MFEKLLYFKLSTFNGERKTIYIKKENAIYGIKPSDISYLHHKQVIMNGNRQYPICTSVGVEFMAR